VLIYVAFKVEDLLSPLEMDEAIGSREDHANSTDSREIMDLDEETCKRR
jgi:hypothetical protein